VSDCITACLLLIFKVKLHKTQFVNKFVVEEALKKKSNSFIEIEFWEENNEITFQTSPG
jgi:hypothetical protein